MTTSPSQPTNEELAAAREIHPEYSQEWLNKLDKTTSSYTYFKSCFEDAEGKRNHYAAIIHKHNEENKQQHELDKRMLNDAREQALAERDHNKRMWEGQINRTKIAEQECDQLRARLGPIDPGGGDRIDELESANNFLKYDKEQLRARVGELEKALELVLNAQRLVASGAHSMGIIVPEIRESINLLKELIERTPSDSYKRLVELVRKAKHWDAVVAVAKDSMSYERVGRFVEIEHQSAMNKSTV